MSTDAPKKEVISEAGMISQVGWNSVSQVTANAGNVVGGTAITAGQEVLYSKLIRRVMGRGTDRGWMDLIIFSLVTAGTDVGLGGWLGEKPAADTASWMEVGYEFFRPLVSVIMVNYVLKVASLGVHNPIKSFGFRELLIQLAAKELAYVGNGLLAKNIEAARDHIRNFEGLQRQQQFAARFRK